MSTKPVPLSPDQPCTDRQEHKIGKLAKLDRILLARGGIDDSGIFPNAIWRGGGGAKKFVIAKRGSGQRIPSLSRRWKEHGNSIKRFSHLDSSSIALYEVL